MRRLLILVFICMLFLVGCSDTTFTNLTFKGQSSHWKGECVQRAIETWPKDSNGTLDYKSSGSSKLILTYIGKDASKINSIKYKYEAGSSGGSGDMPVDLKENPSVVLRKISGENISIIRKDYVIVVTVEWNGMSEVIRLTSK